MRKIGSKRFGMLDFEPWPPVPDNELIPSPELVEDIGTSARLAHAILLRSRDELKAIHEKLDGAEIDVMKTWLNETRNKVGALAAMIDEAFSRVQSIDDCASRTRQTIAPTICTAYNCTESESPGLAPAMGPAMGCRVS
jgi:hypothetical protein